MIKISDKKHAEIVKGLIKHFIYLPCSSIKNLKEGKLYEVLNCSKKYFVYEIESPYNYYGERGFVDLVIGNKLHKEIFSFWDSQKCESRGCSPSGKKICTIKFFEVKTEIRDIGETFRQLQKIKRYYLLSRNEIKGIPICDYSTKVLILVILDTIENLKILEEYKDVFNSLNENDFHFFTWIATYNDINTDSNLEKLWGKPYFVPLAHYKIRPLC